MSEGGNSLPQRWFTPYADQAQEAKFPWAEMGVQHWNLGTPKFFQEFEYAAEKFYSFLPENNLSKKTISIDIPYATHYHSEDRNINKDLYERQMKTGILANTNILKLYSIMDKFGFKNAGLRNHQPFMDGSHRWGQVAFHYSIKDYEVMEKGILQAL